MEVLVVSGCWYSCLLSGWNNHDKPFTCIKWGKVRPDHRGPSQCVVCRISSSPNCFLLQRYSLLWPHLSEVRAATRSPALQKQMDLILPSIISLVLAWCHSVSCNTNWIIKHLSLLLGMLIRFPVPQVGTPHIRRSKFGMWQCENSNLCNLNPRSSKVYHPLLNTSFLTYFIWKILMSFKNTNLQSL